MAVALGWIIGIVIAKELSYPWWIWVGLASLVALLGGVIYYWWYRYLTITLLMVGVTLAAAHFTWVDKANESLITQVVGEKKELTGRIGGRIQSAPVVDGNRLQMIVRVHQLQLGRNTIFPKEDILLQVRILSEEEQQVARQLQRGMQLQFIGKLELPSPARNPGAFDYQAYLYRQGIHWLAKVEGVGKLQVVDGEASHWRAPIDHLRQYLGQRIEEIYPQETAGLMQGMLLGDRGAVPKEVERDFSLLGLIHLLAISGLHVGVFIACLYGVLKRIGFTREKAAGMVILFLPGYVLLTGAGPPVIRAAVMAGLGLLAVIIRRWRDGLSFLAVAALLLLWWNPYLLFEPGFQLSFLITFALLVGVGPLSRLFPFPWKRFNQLLAVTLVAQLASFPIIITYFHEYSLLSWAVNLLLVPVVSGIVIPLGLVALVLGLIHAGLAAIPAMISSSILSGTIYIAEEVATWYPWHRSWSPPGDWWLAGYAVLCCYTFIAWTGNLIFSKVQRGLSLLLLGALVVFSSFPASTKGEVRVTFLDVGQGDAAVIETPRGQVIVVDGGGQPFFPREPWERRRRERDIGEQILVPYLKYRGIQEIDYVVMTHGDADHIEGLKALAKRFPIRYVIRNEHPPGTALEEEVLEQLWKNGAQIHTVSAGSSWTLEPDVSWHFLNPMEGTKGVVQSSNNSSVVFLLQAFDQTLLMTGDIEEEVEERLAAQWNAPPVNVLKVAHHGSRTSSSEKWLDRIQPQVAVISAGRNNRFGHPSPEVLKRLAERGIKIFRTDHQGAITLRMTKRGFFLQETIKNKKTELTDN